MRGCLAAAIAACAAALAGCAGEPFVARPSAASGATVPAAAAGTAARPSATAKGIAVRNGDFESPAPNPNECAPQWDCMMHNTVDAFRFTVQDSVLSGGKQALCVRRVKRETWAMARQYLIVPHELRGATARLSMQVRTQGVEGKGAGPWASLQGIAGQPLGEVRKLVSGTSGWQRLSVEVPIHEWTHAIEVGLLLEGGGEACVDDVRLEVVGK